MKTGIITIDPGYDGMEYVGGSDLHHRASALGDPQNSFTPEISICLADQLKLLIHHFIFIRDTYNVFFAGKARHTHGPLGWGQQVAVSQLIKKPK